MGDIFLGLTIVNIRDMERQQKVSFLVDTGATRAWIPQEIAERLGIEPVGTMPLEPADGNIREYPYGVCLFNFGGEIAAGNVIIGPQDPSRWLGPMCCKTFALLSIWNVTPYHAPGL
jgi:hypothetical protein